MLRSSSLIILAVVVSACAGTKPVVVEPARSIEVSVDDYLTGCLETDCGFVLDPDTAVDTVIVLAGGVREVRLNDAFAQVPWREEAVAAFRQGVGALLPAESVTFTVLGRPVEALVPNHLRSTLRLDDSRRPVVPFRPRPLVSFPEGAPVPTRGLAGRHIALWASHGWYYEPSLDRWEWQRARLFTTVEDVLPTSFVLPYLAPMLERSGAYVWMPRERDTQVHMAVVDNDGGGEYGEVCDWQAGDSGFGIGEPPYGPDELPWDQGTFRWIGSDPAGTCTAHWETPLPAPGQYGAYVSHGDVRDATTKAFYTIEHAGGITRATVDQSMAAGTWIYLGSYTFEDSARVTLSNQGPTGTVVSADAVRFGGGQGVIERGGKTSGRPRWVEAARYTLQFDGMPASLVYNVTDSPANDYVDDYRNRGEWVNYLRGAPLGPNKDPRHEGLGVPIDLSLAFHTDAGVAGGDTTIGTLAIYSSRGFGPDGEEARTFNDGRSRFANRDLADLLQTQIVDDIRELFDSTWSRRAIWDRDYSEAYRPNVPSMLLELLSHQNFADMRFALDPRFRFHVGRAIYKGILRYLYYQEGAGEPVIAPLAPDHLYARTGRQPGSVTLSWRPVSDPLEPSAEATGFRVYTRRNRGGFDNGVTVSSNQLMMDVPEGITSFRVTALNEGGESAPSEVVAASVGSGERVLVISGFDRVGPPAAVDHGRWRGFPDFLDQGVADVQDLGFVGAQHGFDAGVPWQDDDEPGHGASHADWETRIEPGNTFDFSATMGHDLVAAGAGASFDTASDEAVASGAVSLDEYDFVYVLLGEERARVPGHPESPEFATFSPELRDVLRAAASRDIPILISGAYVSQELTHGSEEELAFSTEILGATHRSERASRTGQVVGVTGPFEGVEVYFNSTRGGSVYAVENPEALVPANQHAETVLRYGDSNMSAAVGAGRVLTIGFPLETIEVESERLALLGAAVSYLSNR